MKLGRKLLPHAVILFALIWLICAGEEAIEKTQSESQRGGFDNQKGNYSLSSEEQITVLKSSEQVLDSKNNSTKETPTEAVQVVLDEKGNAPQAILFGSLGGSIAMAMSAVGSAIGISKAGVGATHLGLVEPSRMLRGMLPVVMSELLSIYGLIVGVVISLSVGNSTKGYTMTAGFMHLAAGSCVGFCGLGAGFAIGSVGNACCQAYQRTPHIFTAMVLMLVFAEAIGLYGLIGALVLHGNAGK